MTANSNVSRPIGGRVILLGIIILIGRIADAHIPHGAGYSCPLLLISMPALLICCLPPLLLGLSGNAGKNQQASENASWRPIPARTVKKKKTA